MKLIGGNECLVALYFAVVWNSVTAESKTIIQEESDNVKADHEINFPKNLFSFQLNASTMTALSFFCSCLSIWEKDRILENTGEVTGSQTELLSKLQPATGFFYCI